jgi:uncharacterized FAD-dependent dehydrogenase
LKLYLILFINHLKTMYESSEILQPSIVFETKQTKKYDKILYTFCYCLFGIIVGGTIGLFLMFIYNQII